jgi:hypothetical protein
MNHDPSTQSTERIPTQPLPSNVNLVTALTSLLTPICASTKWEYGEAWIPAATYPILELSSAWSVDPNLAVDRANAWMQFQICSQEFVLGRGEGLPGRVWQSCQPEWLNDVSAQSESYFLRHQIAKALNVKAGLALPIVVNSQVLAVVVFFMSKARLLDPAIIASTQTAIGNFKSNFYSTT